MHHCCVRQKVEWLCSPRPSLIGFLKYWAWISAQCQSQLNWLSDHKLHEHHKVVFKPFPQSALWMKFFTVGISLLMFRLFTFLYYILLKSCKIAIFQIICPFSLIFYFLFRNYLFYNSLIVIVTKVWWI